MDAIFSRKKKWGNLLLLLIGLSELGVFAMVLLDNPDAPGIVAIFLIMGLLFSGVAVGSLSINRGAFLRIEEHTIRGKYHWFGRIDCDLAEVAFAQLQLNGLMLLLKNGKRHSILGIENDWELCSAIRRRIHVPEAESPDVLRQQLAQLRAQRKKDILWVLGGLVLMVVCFLLVVWLLSRKELLEKTDWVILGVLGGLELLTLAGTFYMAVRGGNKLLPIYWLDYRLRGAVILSQPLVPGNVRGVYTDENHNGRITLFGFPGQESVYFCVEDFDRNCTLVTVHTSEIHENLSQLNSHGFLDGLLDITAFCTACSE